ncbi:MAG: 1-deoxy-D-xylulose-5-phosphate reductoisomerase [Sphaerochaetaceae bacterium]|nr:1-deoxy-D-xylulose-5-phosphate reductoisomerase [Sphaerochaetaceae bacterium]MDC7236411.1 1-deoxy-D-xylulose-5-phosphate reductoisomerase [Sphaerochaetaceae bacterium]MDC7250235.1 1-deoxy-D-xylulose-5-phosphate reductoisomerase [Sphaerochaetaceae bacterium]
MKKVIIFGATGSIGTTCLNAIKEKQLPIEVVGISANNNYKKLEKIAYDFKVKNLLLTKAKSFNSSFNFFNNSLDLIESTPCDVVLNGVSGFDGLKITIDSIMSGKDVALANKESVVAGGEFIFDLAAKNNCKIIPVDSEHSAIKALIDSHDRVNVKSLIITASGGPFRNLEKKDFNKITVEKALNHPTWKMGPKITIDSSTLANKALEVIEASYLFNFDSKDIEVTVHPQSIVHSMIRLFDGAVYAQMGNPNMSLPIIEGIYDCYCNKELVKPLDFTNLSLTFEKPNYDNFPLLGSAYEVLEKKGGYPIAFNAANEEAVYAFLEEKISYLKLQEIVLKTISSDFNYTVKDFNDVLSIDEKARRIAKSYI